MLFLIYLAQERRVDIENDFSIAEKHTFDIKNEAYSGQEKQNEKKNEKFVS